MELVPPERRTNFARIMAETHPDWKAYEWAGYLGADPKVLRMYKRGEWEFTVAHLTRFAELLDVEPRDLLGWDEDLLWNDPFAKLLNREERHSLQE
jgi:hypothetical protein